MAPIPRTEKVHQAMRFCRFRRADGWVGMGICRDDAIIPLENVDATLPPRLDQLMVMEPYLPGRLAGIESAQPLRGEVRLLPPVHQPEKVLCVGLNYRDHAIETGKQPTPEPVIFSKLPSAIIGPEDPIILPASSQKVDYEAELVVVIGRTCHDVDESQAMDYVFGFCCGHDVSARDWQQERPGGQWLLGKSFDTFAPIGPCLVHKSQVPHAEDLAIEMRISGEAMQQSRTSEMIFSIPMLVSYLSKIVTLRAGDLLFTGTPAGVGTARTPPRYLRPGDRCEVTIESLGTLSNPCVAHDSPEARAWREMAD